MKGDRRPIGVMDSGLGGISVLRAATRLMPEEDFFYFGDSANAPYGPRTLEEIRTLTAACVEILLAHDVKEIILACNTATSASASILRETYPQIPIIGIEPALKPAVERYPGGRVLVTATETTLREEKFRALMHRYETRAKVDTVPLGGIVRFVEDGKQDSEELIDYLRKELSGFEIPNAMVLGCTHFPFAANAFHKVLGDDVELIDGAYGTVCEAKRRLNEAGIRNDSDHVGQVTILQSGMDPEWITRANTMLFTAEL